MTLLLCFAVLICFFVVVVILRFESICKAKYLATPRRTSRLKYFFDSEVQTGSRVAIGANPVVKKGM